MESLTIHELSIFRSSLIVFIVLNVQLFSLNRSEEDSFSRGILSEASFIQGKKRRLVNLKMCFTGWLIEALATLSAILTPFLHNLGLHNLHFPDVIIMSVVIPFVHLINDEDTKAIIAEENWYQGIRHMLGIYKQVAPAAPERIPRPSQNQNRRVHPFPGRNAETISAEGPILSQRRIPRQGPVLPQERTSSQGPIPPEQPILHRGSISPQGSVAIHQSFSPHGRIQPQEPISPQESISPISTIFLDK